MHKRSLRSERLALSGDGGGGGGELPPPKAGGATSASFLGPHTPFSYLPSALGRRPLFSSGHGLRGPLSLWNQWVTVTMGDD